MCGIVGVCGKILNKEEVVFKTLLCLDTIRGPDSTGVLAVSENSVSDIFKKVGTPWGCFGEKGFNNIFKFNNVLLLGHNRMATVGNVTAKNAHPFDVGDIIGVHNGTIKQEHKLDDHEYFDVDSETVLHNFAKNGTVNTCKILDGAYAVVFYDKRDHSVHMLRNKERPLYYVYSKDMKTLFWASENWMLHIATARGGVEIGEIVELPEMTEKFFQLPKQPPGKVAQLPEMSEIVLKKEEPKPYYTPWRETKKTSNGTQLTVVKSLSVERTKLLSFIGKDILFSATGLVTGKHQSFIRGYVELPGADIVEVRIFMSTKNVKHAELCSSQNKIWEGHVKKASVFGVGKGYLLLDNRTIKAADTRKIDGIIEGDQKCFNLFHSRLATAQEWLDKTSCGCDNCGDIPQMKDAKDLEWYDADRFFCKPCFNTQKVQSYLSVMTKEDRLYG